MFKFCIGLVFVICRKPTSHNNILKNGLKHIIIAIWKVTLITLQFNVTKFNGLHTDCYGTN